jgi:hypothetical protein
MTSLRHATILLCLALAAGRAGAADRPHEHGVARLDVAVEGQRIVLQLETPLDNLVGYEHAPRNDAERQRADAVVAQLKAADQLFTIDGAAQCKLAKVTLQSAALGLDAAAAPAAADEHADLDGTYEFECRNAGRAGFVDVALFDAFPRLARIDVQAIAPKGQLRATLRRPSRRIALVR